MVIPETVHALCVLDKEIYFLNRHMTVNLFFEHNILQGLWVLRRVAIMRKAFSLLLAYIKQPVLYLCLV